MSSSPCQIQKTTQISLTYFPFIKCLKNQVVRADRRQKMVMISASNASTKINCISDSRFIGAFTKLPACCVNGDDFCKQCNASTNISRQQIYRCLTMLRACCRCASMTFHLLNGITVKFYFQLNFSGDSLLTHKYTGKVPLYKIYCRS